MYLTACVNNVSKCGEPTTLARRMHLPKSLMSYPWGMDAFVDMLRARRENVHVHFHCRACTTLIFCYKIASVPWGSLANQAIFLCNWDICAPRMGCKRGFRWYVPRLEVFPCRLIYSEIWRFHHRTISITHGYRCCASLSHNSIIWTWCVTTCWVILRAFDFSSL